MPVESAPGWWEWVLLIPSLALLAFLLRRGFRPEHPEPPSAARSLVDLFIAFLLVFFLRLLAEQLAWQVLDIPFLPAGWAIGGTIILADAVLCIALIAVVHLAGYPPAILGLFYPGRLRNVALLPLSYLSFLVPLGILLWIWLGVLHSLGYRPLLQPAVEIYRDASLHGDWADMAAIAAGAVIMAPLAEELLFRGFIFGLLRGRLGVGAAVLLTSAAFAAFHINIEVVLPIFFVGVVLNLIYLRTGRLAYPILFHVLFNGGTLLWIGLVGI